MRGPFFITFEGIDGSGKSSQIRRLIGRLVDLGADVLVTREPGGTALGEAIRSMLLDPAGAGMTVEAEVLLYSASRAQHVAEVIRPALAAGRIVVCERYVDSTVAYQCWGGGCDRFTIEAINRFSTGGLMPDLTVLLDVSPEVGAIRRSTRTPDRIERRTSEFHQKVREGYLDIAGSERDRVRVVDASRGVRVVADEVFETVMSALRERGLVL